MTWGKKAAVGAVGGIALALLKLIENKFFVNLGLSPEVYGHLMTYAAYIALGMIVAVFLVDPDTPEPKMGRSAFVLGLAAPSVLIAITLQPINPDKPGKQNEAEIPKITGGFFVSSAHAQAKSQGNSDAQVWDISPDLNYSQWSEQWAKAAVPPIVSVKEADVSPTFKDGVLTALGRPQPTNNYIFVVGIAEDRGAAITYADQVNKMLKGKATWNATGEVPANFASVLQLEGTDKYVVTVGGAGSKGEIASVQANTDEVAKMVMLGNTSIGDRKLAERIRHGKVVNGKSLF